MEQSARAVVGSAKGRLASVRSRRFRALTCRGAAYAAHGLPVMDVEQPMLHRVDGHMDPLHYCLPGPPDFYSYVLWNFALGQ